jgi:hypothetical protein
VSADLLLAFRQQIGAGRPGAAAAPLERCAARLVELGGVAAARAFSLTVVLGERTPAFYPELVICELDDTVHGRRVAVASPGGGRPGGGFPRADGWGSAAWQGTSVGPRSDFELPGHLYLNFSAAPPSLWFAAYSAWYQVHQDENIAHSPVLRRGWRYRLESLGQQRGPGPSHLAIYELDGTLEALTADLGRAMQAGQISLPDWFDRFASLEATAVGARVSR